jgi:hypothetical protein
MSWGRYLIIADGVVDRPYAVNGYLLPPITCTQYTASPHTDQRGFPNKPRARVAEMFSAVLLQIPTEKLPTSQDDGVLFVTGYLMTLFVASNGRMIHE